MYMGRVLVLRVGLLMITNAASAQVRRLSDADSDGITAGGTAFSVATTNSTIGASGSKATGSLTIGGSGSGASGSAQLFFRATLTSAFSSASGTFMTGQTTK